MRECYIYLDDVKKLIQQLKQAQNLRRRKTCGSQTLILSNISFWTILLISKVVNKHACRKNNSHASWPDTLASTKDVGSLLLQWMKLNLNLEKTSISTRECFPCKTAALPSRMASWTVMLSKKFAPPIFKIKRPPLKSNAKIFGPKKFCPKVSILRHLPAQYLLLLLPSFEDQVLKFHI